MARTVSSARQRRLVPPEYAAFPAVQVAAPRSSSSGVPAANLLARSATSRASAHLRSAFDLDPVICYRSVSLSPPLFLSLQEKFLESLVY